MWRMHPVQRGMVYVHGGMEDVQQRAAHQLVVLAATDQTTHNTMDLLGVAIGKLCGVALNANAALLPHGINGADLYQRFAAAAKQDAEILAVSGLAQVGTIPKGAVKTVALEREKRVKSLACEIVTGKAPRYWRELLGGGRGVRDALDQRDLRQYQKCYEFLVNLLQSGVKSEASLVKTATPVYGGKVNMDKYLIKVPA